VADLRHIVIVGASLGGLRAAETLRSEGHEGTITLIGDESHAPYDRPPLSKQVLQGEWEPGRVALAGGANDALDLQWERGVAATALDIQTQEVTLADGRRVAYDGLIIATGATARRLRGTRQLEGLHTLRTLDDAVALRGALDAGVTRVVVVGAGFIGAEVAASCRQVGVEVVLVEPLEAPLARILGAAMGGVIADVHREHGVDLRLGTGVDAVNGEERDRKSVV